MYALILPALFVVAIVALAVWLLISSSRPLFRSLWDLMAASARSGTGMNPRRYRRFPPEGEIWEMEIRNRSS